jgi:hypothetical protein
MFAWLFPVLKDRILNKGDFGMLTVDKLIKCNKWLTIVIVEAILIGILLGLEYYT